MKALLHGGVTRMVFLVGRWAIKLPTVMYGWKFFLYGLLANMQEREWSSFDKKLCPVLWSSKRGWFVIMPRCAPLTDEEFCNEVGEGWGFACDVTTGEQMSVTLPVEMKTCSFGRLNGQVVAVDYGGCGRRGRTTRTIADLYSE